jgi:hypothetical protein
MNSLPSPSPHGKSNSDSPATRELTLSALRVATARAKLEVNLLESITINLRQKVVSCSEALAQLKAEGISLQVRT